MIEPVTIRVPGKINLGLVIGPARGDGFHELASLFQAISLYDTLTASPAEPGTVTIEVEGVGAEEVGPPEENLAVRAACLLAERVLVERRGSSHNGAQSGADLGAHLHLTKGIPVAGGMAGGSADAAAALLACNRLWGLDASQAVLLELAAELGSDVPFTLLAGTAVGSGRGEQLQPLEAPHPFHWVLVTSGQGLSTPAVFRRFDELHPPATVPTPAVPQALLDAVAGGDPYVLAATLRNDLADPALDLRPDLREVLGVGEEAGALRGMVSGSGPTVAFLAADAESADALAARLRDHWQVDADGDEGTGDGPGDSRPVVHAVIRASSPASIGYGHAGRG